MNEREREDSSHGMEYQVSQIFRKIVLDSNEYQDYRAIPESSPGRDGSKIKIMQSPANRESAPLPEPDFMP